MNSASRTISVTLHLDLISDLKRINSHICAIAYPILDSAGALVPNRLRQSVIVVLRDRSRVRARIDEDCSALDFYDGFYVQPEDEQLCARRDEISSRMGGSCKIEKFRSLVPQFKR